MRKVKSTVVTVSMLAFAGLTSAAEINNWLSSSGEVWKNAYGECWRNSSWTPATAHPDCDGALKRPVQVAEVSKPSQVDVTKPTATIAQAAATPPPIIKTSYSTDTLFDFDKSVIKPEGRKALDGLVDRLRNINVEVVIAVGHTDSIGSDAYNNKLGLRRAESVKAYLISRGLEKNRVYTESKGERQPVADNKTREGRARNRRVEIEVIGIAK